jgi:hypothetical protein
MRNKKKIVLVLGGIVSAFLLIALSSATAASQSSGLIRTVAGNGTAGFSGDGGPAISAAINGAEGVALDSAGILF